MQLVHKRGDARAHFIHIPIHNVRFLGESEQEPCFGKMIFFFFANFWGSESAVNGVPPRRFAIANQAYRISLYARKIFVFYVTQPHSFPIMRYKFCLFEVWSFKLILMHRLKYICTKLERVRCGKVVAGVYSWVLILFD